MADERLYIVTYDIADPKRWRHVFRLMKGYGRWLQLSVFQCRLTPRRRQELAAALDDVVHHHEDHVLIIDVGPADTVAPRVESLGKTFQSVERKAIIV
jgi:CRISPR-associated protein Cas2